MIAEACRRGCKLYECDIRAAFTTAKMDMKLYFEGPRPMTPPGKVCECLKGVEGSKQAGNLYYKEHSECMTKKLDMERCQAYPNLYRRIWDQGKFIFVGVLVDNCLILPSCEEILDWFLTEYRKHYTITGGNEVTKFNGVQIEQSDGKISFLSLIHISEPTRPY